MGTYILIAVEHFIVFSITYLIATKLFKFEKSYGLMIVIFIVCILVSTFFAKRDIGYSVLSELFRKEEARYGRALSYEERKEYGNRIKNSDGFDNFLTSQALYATMKTSSVTFLIIFFMTKPTKKE